MAKFKKLFGLITLGLTLALVCPVLAQPPGGGGPGPGGGAPGQPGGPMGPGGGMGPGRMMGPMMMYDPQTVTTVTGTVATTAVSQQQRRRQMAQGMVMLSTKEGEVMVHLGPPWYLHQQKLDLKAGDTLEVKGSKITQNGVTTILAAEVTSGGQTVKLRDEQGVPLWRGAGRPPTSP